jgi:hypothetical protein
LSRNMTPSGRAGRHHSKKVVSVRRCPGRLGRSDVFEDLLQSKCTLILPCAKFCTRTLITGIERNNGRQIQACIGILALPREGQNQYHALVWFITGTGHGQAQECCQEHGIKQCPCDKGHRCSIAGRSKFVKQDGRGSVAET